MASTISSYGQNAVGTSAEKVVATNSGGAVAVILKALSTNTEIIYIGTDANVTSGNGFPLSPGEVVVWPVRDTDNCWAISASGSQTLAFAVESL
jgi:hypothetical protein